MCRSRSLCEIYFSARIPSRTRRGIFLHHKMVDSNIMFVPVEPS
jgi:hypothetical protein